MYTISPDPWNYTHISHVCRNPETCITGLAPFNKNGRPQRGINRLYHILVSETAYLVWKLRNERRIRDDEGPIQTDDEVRKRWTHAVNKRAHPDRLLTNSARFKKNAIEAKLVKATWSGCLAGEEDLPSDWPTAKGVLVGISVTRPSAHLTEESHTVPHSGQCVKAPPPGVSSFPLLSRSGPPPPTLQVLATTPKKKKKETCITVGELARAF